ncbi:uncharacterized protein EDB93DRAFT_1269771 [Suillus bovinus]|uniref:uncharacterized protein n=1 Tax=Suillus bovinus TaxID=48563 RepID=UPI001B88146F|nr:uncharacterized protein EDB93DRAFT_1269771 [Suillus bovinus]KAG2127919.1 hypothetical protein EDB93DRAFT_1269771 [Suillus bovinus]
MPFPMPRPWIPPQTTSPTQVPNTSSYNVPNTNIKLVPFAANDISESRYENRPLVDKAQRRNGIPALQRQFPNESCPWLSGDWQSCVHPEGVLYLYNDRRRVFTEATLDHSMFKLLDGCVDELYELAQTRSVDLGAGDIELVVQLAQNEAQGAQVFCYYYFVDHTARILFWLHDRNQETDSDIFSGLQGVTDLSHIRYSLVSEYWFVTLNFVRVLHTSCKTYLYSNMASEPMTILHGVSRTHCECYPDHQMDRPKIIKELRELVVHAITETITSDTSLSPFDGDELSRILELINHLKENALDNDPHSTCVIARFMHYFYRAKFFNFCGLPCARLEADKSVYEEDKSFHLLTSSASFAFDAMLFWAPQSHLEGLRKVWVDECINTPRWKDFNKNLMTEWTGITIYSTVMLAVDVSFLAVPNVNISQSQSIGIIATYLSTIFITGSLIVSVLLVRQNQRYGFESADKATVFLSHMTGTFFGVGALATIHSLPYAMLMWG